MWNNREKELITDRISGKLHSITNKLIELSEEMPGTETSWLYQWQVQWMLDEFDLLADTKYTPATTGIVRRFSECYTDACAYKHLESALIYVPAKDTKFVRPSNEHIFMLADIAAFSNAEKLRGLRLLYEKHMDYLQSRKHTSVLANMMGRNDVVQSIAVELRDMETISKLLGK